MTTQKTVPDAHGRHWVYLSKVDVQANPLGTPGIVIWMIAAWLIGNAGFGVILTLADGAIGPQVFWPILFLAAAIGLIFRAYWAWWLSMLCGARVIWIFAIVGGAKIQGGGALFFLINAMIAAAVAFYLLEGDRPNLIYRLRYRSYRAEQDENP